MTVAAGEPPAVATHDAVVTVKTLEQLDNNNAVLSASARFLMQVGRAQHSRTPLCSCKFVPGLAHCVCSIRVSALSLLVCSFTVLLTSTQCACSAVANVSRWLALAPSCSPSLPLLSRPPCPLASLLFFLHSLHPLLCLPSFPSAAVQLLLHLGGLPLRRDHTQHQSGQERDPAVGSR